MRSRYRPAPVARTDDANDICIAFSDEPVQVSKNEVHACRSSPMAQETLLDMFRAEWFPQQWILLKINLADCEVIGGAPVAVDPGEQFRRQGAGGLMCGRIMYGRRIDHC